MSTWREKGNAGELLERATMAGLNAMAYVVQGEVAKRIAPGYLSSLGNQGNFVVGNALGSITIQPAHWEGDLLVARVGTDLDYMLFWELGHNNLFTRHFERSEQWVPAFLETQDRQAAAFLRVFRQVAGDGVAPPTPGNDVEIRIPERMRRP